MAAPSTPAAQALLDALADRPGATATELAQAAQIGRSTAAKLLATLASQDRVLRQPGGRRGGRPAAPTRSPMVRRSELGWRSAGEGSGLGRGWGGSSGQRPGGHCRGRRVGAAPDPGQPGWPAAWRR